MTLRNVLVVVAVLTVSVAVMLAGCARSGEGTAMADGSRISGPFTHDNLAVFLIHGPDKIQGKTYLTLQEAMEAKKVVVAETGNVNELTIENVSNEDVYIQSGDIVKGGRQDRTIQNDLVCPAKSGKMPLAAFCVEHGRWSGRGNEAASQFGSSAMNLSSKALKVAAKGANDQSAVWAEVSNAQGKMSTNAGRSVASTQSASSLQLSLEDKGVQEAIGAYQSELAGIVDKKADVIGYAFAINGKLNSVDVYASHSLFIKMWPKNLRASSVEAFAEYKKDAKFEPLKAQAVEVCLADAAKGKQSTQKLTERVQLVTRESKDNLQYETIDAKAAAPAHMNIITRDSETERVLQNRAMPANGQPNAPVPQQAPRQQNNESNQPSH